MGGWNEHKTSESHALGVGSMRSIEDAHRLLDLLAIPANPLALRVLELVGRTAGAEVRTDRMAEMERVLGTGDMRAIRHLMASDPVAHGLVTLGIRIGRAEEVRDQTRRIVDGF